MKNMIPVLIFSFPLTLACFSLIRSVCPKLKIGFHLRGSCRSAAHSTVAIYENYIWKKTMLIFQMPGWKPFSVFCAFINKDCFTA
jgi:hypothetical protein